MDLPLDGARPEVHLVPAPSCGPDAVRDGLLAGDDLGISGDDLHTAMISPDLSLPLLVARVRNSWEAQKTFHAKYSEAAQ
ncbi:MAG: hypothetical protein R3F40_10445 [Candidatus Competibacteraceae bacterium]